MIGLGTIINCALVLLGGLLGFLFGKALKQSYQDIMTRACGISTIFIGASGALKYMLSIVDGSLVLEMDYGYTVAENAEGGLDITVNYGQMGEKTYTMTAEQAKTVLG